MRKPNLRRDFDEGDGSYDHEGFDKAMGDYCDAERDRDIEQKIEKDDTQMKKAIRFKTLVDENDRVHRKVDVLDVVTKEIDFIYDALDIKTFDVSYLTKDFGAFCDDNGLITSNNPVFDYGDGIKLAGNLLVYKGVDEEGDTVWFDKDEDVDLMLDVISYLHNAELIGVTA